MVMNPTRNWDTGSYQCFATNSLGTVVSREAKLQFARKFLLARLVSATFNNMELNSCAHLGLKTRHRFYLFSKYVDAM